MYGDVSHVLVEGHLHQKQEVLASNEKEITLKVTWPKITITHDYYMNGSFYYKDFKLHGSGKVK